MSVGPIEVARRVWVAGAPLDRAPRSGHPGDLARAAGMPPWRAREFLAGRGALRALLVQVVPAAADAEVLAGPNGKPALKGWDRLGVNVSHDGAMVAAGVALGRDVGVDVQEPAAEPAAGLLRRCLGGAADALTALPPDRAAAELAWVWTAQEACVKASGQGISGRPWTIGVRPGQRHGTWRGFRWLSLRDHSAVPFSCAFDEEEGPHHG